MIRDGREFVVDSVSKFFNTVRVMGWFHAADEQLVSVDVADRHTLNKITRVGEYHGGVSNLGNDKGFSIQMLRSTDEFDENIALIFSTSSGWRCTVKLSDLCDDRLARMPTPELSRSFIDLVRRNPGCNLLDIGGRNRSRKDRSKYFPDANVTVLDVIPADNVDIVCDAHGMASIIPAEHYDFVYSVSVFEHLLMPWAVALQMNAVMKLGGSALISTHQTLGMHDQPWDYWRFSDESWHGIFNKHTGFEIVEARMDLEQYIIPFIYRKEKRHAERSAGYEGSAVLVRKVGQTQLDWPLKCADIVTTKYPENEDGQNPDETLI